MLIFTELSGNLLLFTILNGTIKSYIIVPVVWDVGAVRTVVGFPCIMKNTVRGIRKRKEGIIMYKFKKLVSSVIVLMMLIGVFTALPFTVSAEEASSGNTITVSSNLCSSQTYSYSEADKQVTVTYYFKSDYNIVNQQAVLTYDSSVLSYSSTNTVETFVPAFVNGTEYNDKITGEVYANSTNIPKFYDLKTKTVYAQATFDIIGTGSAYVNLDVEYLTGTEGANFSEYLTKGSVNMITKSEVLSSNYEASCEAVLSQEVPVTTVAPTTEPTTAEPTTVAPTTEPTTVAPTTAPASKKTIKVGVISYVYNETKDSESSYQVHYWNDGGLEGDSACTSLGTTESKSVGSSYWSGSAQTFRMYQASIPAEATGYKFHIGDRWFGGDGNTAKNNAVYIFNYSGDKALYDTYVEPTTVAPTTEPTTVAPTTVAPTTVAPTTVAPTTVAPTTVAPTTVAPTTEPATTVPSGSDDFSSYLVKGEITAAFKNSNTANIVTTTLDLSAGTYKFMIQNSETGVKYGRKSEYTDTVTKALFGANWGYCTFTATGGTYTFTYNTKANALTITYDSSSASSLSDMKLKGHISLAMKDYGTGVIKNTIDLPVGVYNFGISDGDSMYGRMTTYSDIMPKSIVGKSWGYCKLNVTKAGTFEFTYDTNNKYMTVLPKSANDSDYIVMGDGFAMVLKNTDTANVVEETVTLSEGTYAFKIFNDTVSYGRKATYTDTISKAMFGKGWDSCTLNATGGTYTFSYNTKSNTLTVTKV